MGNVLVPYVRMNNVLVTNVRIGNVWFGVQRQSGRADRVGLQDILRDSAAQMAAQTKVS